MSEQNTSHPQTGMDRFFNALRSIGIRRRTHDKWIAGVCSGLADRLGIDPIIVRVALVILTMLGGAGIALYLVAWAPLPHDRDELPAQRALRRDRGPVVGQAGPGDEVDGDAGTPQHGEDYQGDADDDRIDAEPVGEPRAHAGDPLVMGAASDADAAQCVEEPVHSRLRVGCVLFAHVTDSWLPRIGSPSGLTLTRP